MKASVLPMRYILLWLMFMALLPANAQQLVMPALQDEEGELYVQSPAYLYELMNDPQIKYSVNAQ